MSAMLKGTPGEGSTLVRIYLRSHWVLARFTRVLSTAFNGFWLGVLTREQLHSIGELYYSSQHIYWTDEWNKRGLFDWERRALEGSYTECKKILVAAAGGGREVIALRKLGFEVEGFESHPELVRFCNELLQKEGLVPDIKQAPWDHCPDANKTYDGVIIGWGAYMHIRGRERRVMFLRELRDRVATGSPILISFYPTGENSRYFRWVARIAGVPARILGRDSIHVGDCLSPNYTHFFTKKRVESEMVEGGFEPVSYGETDFGYAIGRAV